MNNLKPCPFCGSSNTIKHSSQYSNQVYHECNECGCSVAFYSEERDFWNTRPAEDELKAKNKELVETVRSMEKTTGRAEKVLGERNLLAAEVERLKAVIAEIGAMTLTGMDDVEDFIFLLCKDTVSDEAIKKAYREHLKKQIANMIDFGKDTDAPTKESEGGKSEQKN